MASERIKNCRTVQVNGQIAEKLMIENAVAVAAQAQADLEFLSMMTGVDLEQDEEEGEVDE